MDNVTLKYFMVVEENQHMTQAAQRLNITQPSLSAAIRRLEAEIGFPLFDRTGRNIELNEYGRIFLKGVVEAESIINASLKEIEKRRSSDVSFVRLACSNSPTNYGLVEFLLSKGLNLRVDNVPDNWESELVENGCDLVITASKLRRSDIESTVLLHQEIVVICRKNHPLAQAERVTVQQLSQYPFSSTSACHSLINVVKDQLLAMNLSPHVTFLGHNSNYMRKAIQSSESLGLMVKKNILPDEDLAILSVEDFELIVPLHLYWRKYDTNSPFFANIRQDIIAFYINLKSKT